MFILSFLIQPVTAEYVDLVLTYPQTVEKGQEVRITFELVNKSNDRLWDGTIMIEESFMNAYKPYIDYQTSSFKFSTLDPGNTFTNTFVLTFNEDIPIDEARFSISLKCGKGFCRGGCTPFFLDKTVTMRLTEKRAEAVINLDTDEFEAYRGETLEIPFVVQNIGEIQMTDVVVEIKGDILSDEKINIPFINPGKEASKVLKVSIDENIPKTAFTPIIVAKFQDGSGKEGMTYESIKINIAEKETIIDEPTESEITDENINENKSTTSGMFYFFLLLSIVAIVAVVVFLVYLFKR